MLILNSDDSTPLYLQIYDQLKKEIISGELLEGNKLPSTRSLSLSLNVSRNTVENAYMQLCSEGYIESKAGSGFIVLKLDKSLLYTDETKPFSKSTLPVVTEDTLPYIPTLSTYKYNFEYGILNADAFPIKTWRKICNKALASITAEDMTTHTAYKGELDLRLEIMKYLNKSRGVFCDAEQLIISTGFSYCLSILCQLLREDFNEIAMEDPGFFGTFDIFRNNGYKVSPIALEKDGLNLKELELSSAQIVYVTPSHQFPTGSVMPIQKRLKLLDWANKSNGLIIEDDYDSELRYNSKPIPSIQSIDKKGKVIYVGTFSKALSPSLRVNYMVIPKVYLDKYNKLFRIYQSPVPLIQQRVLREFMNSGHFETHLRKINVANKKKHDLLINTINQIMGDKVIIHGKNAGLHILLEVCNGLSEEDLLKRAKMHDVGGLMPVSMFWINTSKYSNNMVLLGFGGMTDIEIIDGIKALNDAWFRV